MPELVRLYAQLGEKAKTQFPGWTLAVFTGNPDLGHRLGMRAHKQYALKNGALDAKLLLMEIGGQSIRLPLAMQRLLSARAWQKLCPVNGLAKSKLFIKLSIKPRLMLNLKTMRRCLLIV
ncbi:hypothetical protein HSBAA_17890 [Vreelandella sulfidaeris]|uniref:Uncharacterized protein n=1 Tax=Vreelandella sulfidaeris TaxID=115553 RepID=A0A455U5J9_9GAMM|nr:hypothetical protein HSBAA_17890 [Halomonas sulfidaeris]